VKRGEEILEISEKRNPPRLFYPHKSFLMVFKKCILVFAYIQSEMFEDLHKGGQPWPPISQIIMKITVVGIILLQCLLLSCKNKENSDEIQNINFLEKAIGENGINEIVEKIKIVEFDDNIDSYFSNPKKVIVSDERVYVLDKFNGRSIIKVFTKDCDFINMLDFFGKGPGAKSGAKRTPIPDEAGQ